MDYMYIGGLYNCSKRERRGGWSVKNGRERAYSNHFFKWSDYVLLEKK